jgi:hypothetical protein
MKQNIHAALAEKAMEKLEEKKIDMAKAFFAKKEEESDDEEEDDEDKSEKKEYKKKG